VTVIFVETSALVAMLLDEPGSDALLARLDPPETAMTSTVAVFEAALVVSTRKGLAVRAALQLVQEFLLAAGVRTEALMVSDLNEAARAADLFGKGPGQPAQLNLCNCLAYGAARARGARLLYVGADFARTDIMSA
jgi:ribonuclease VapC